MSLACAAKAPPEPVVPPVETGTRVEQILKEMPDDPRVQAAADAVLAAQAREEAPGVIDTFQIRLGDDYLDEHQIRVKARVPVKRPSDLRSERKVLHAETMIALSQLEAASLERRADLCFPSVEANAQNERADIYGNYAERQQSLLAWNEDLLISGVIDELRGARFELGGRVSLAKRSPIPALQVADTSWPLPEIGQRGGALVENPDHIRGLVRAHHPTVSLHRASSERYSALASRERSRNNPWIRFVDLGYEHRTGNGGQNGVTGQIAFDVPVGPRRGANAERYRTLAMQQKSEGFALVQQQLERTLQALKDLRDFEARSDQWLELEALATRADDIADRWWRDRLARPTAVADLLDEAFAARSVVVDARERAGVAQCTLLAMTGVPVEAWPRE